MILSSQVAGTIKLRRPAGGVIIPTSRRAFLRNHVYPIAFPVTIDNVNMLPEIKIIETHATALR